MSRDFSDIPGVIQAAGLSRRMGELGPKLLLRFRGRALLGHVARAALDSRLAEVVVVLGAEPDRFRAVLPHDPRLRTIVNADYASGRGSTIRAAVADAAPAVPGLLFLLGDQPLMSAALIDAVLAAAEREAARGDEGAELVVPVLGGPPAGAGAPRELKGNPVLFRRSLFPRLLQLDGDRGALALIETGWERAARVPIADPITQTRVETPDDYRRLPAVAAGAEEAP